MKKSHILLCLSLLGVTVVSITLYPFAMDAEARRVAEFRKQAQTILGTNDFEVWYNGNVGYIAVTKDGRQYPTMEDVNVKLQKMLAFDGVMFAIGLSIFAVLLAFDRFYSQRASK